MPKYFFDIRDGWNVLPDEKGIVFPDMCFAELEGHDSPEDLSIAADAEGRSVAAYPVEVADDAGLCYGVSRSSRSIAPLKPTGSDFVMRCYQKGGTNVRYWRKADIGRIRVEWPLLTQSGHSGETALPSC